ncbi:putative ribonuclease H-like domain-containing protein [Tanacetum coccineum]
MRSDNGTEFKNRDMLEFRGNKGIKQEYSNAGTPQQNEVAERMNRTLIEAARTMLADSLLPITFWAEAVSTACYIIGYYTACLATFDGNSTSEVTNSAGTLQTPNANASEKEEEDEELIVMPTALKHTAAKVRPRKSSTNSKAEEFLPELQNLKAQEKEDYSTGISEDTPELLAFRRDLDELAQKHLREVPKNKATSTNSVNSGSGQDNTQPANQDDSDMPELTIFNKPQKGIFDEASYDDEGNNLPTEVAVEASKEGYSVLDYNWYGFSRSTSWSKGELIFFLGLQVKQKTDGIFISQDKYVADMLKKFDLASVKTAITPMRDQGWIDKSEEADEVDVHLYRSMIKTYIVATSTTEAEYVAVASCCGQVLWIQNQMLDYGFNFMNTKIHIDNESTICIVKNPVYHSKTKHIEIRHHFIRDSYEKKLIMVEKIHTDFNVADLLTKAFDGSRFNFLVVNIAISTLADGTLELRATIDTLEYTITEASVRSKLQLADASGIFMLPNTKIFEGMGNMGYPTDGQADQARTQSQPSSSIVPPPPTSQPAPTESTTIPPTLVTEPTSGPSSPSPAPEHEIMEHPFEQPSPEHQSSSPRQESYIPQTQAPTHTHEAETVHMSVDDLFQLVPQLMTRIESLEKDLKQTKQTMGNAIVKLVKKVKKMERYWFTDIKSASEKVSSDGEHVTPQTKRTKKQIREEHASLAEIARIQAKDEAENARREELKRQDELAAKRLQEELELSEAQKKRMAQGKGC